MSEKTKRCVFCMTPEGVCVPTEMTFMRLQDSEGVQYAIVVLPTCREHEGVPTIHHRMLEVTK
jgi:hypothetical protein